VFISIDSETNYRILVRNPIEWGSRPFYLERSPYHRKPEESIDSQKIQIIEK
jgi:hypothetical protein